MNVKAVFRYLGILFVVFGATWFLPFDNILPPSFMTGKVQRPVWGGVVVVMGIGFLFASRRRTQTDEDEAAESQLPSEHSGRSVHID
jgi:hypothetical protein